MGRTVSIVRYPRSVRHRTAAVGRLTPGTVTPAAPRARPELELLRGSRHLIRADIYQKLASLASQSPRQGSDVLESNPLPDDSIAARVASPGPAH